MFDTDTPAENAVVRLMVRGGVCTGILLTPQLVLTANHCLWGSVDNNDCQVAPGVPVIKIGPNFPTGGDNTPSYFPQTGTSAMLRGLAYESRVDACQPDGQRGDDIALVYLFTPVIGSTLTAQINSGSTPAAVPRLAPLTAADPAPPGHGFTWGVAGYGPSSPRRLKLIPNAWLDTDDDDGGSVFDLEMDGWATEGGDSGGPLFVLNTDGTRRPIGIASGINGASMRWTNITASHARGWLLEHAKEGNVDTRLAHSATWLTRHGKTTDSWWGELDYSGPCRDDVDQDCDGWFDRNVPPDQRHDNCSAIANPRQEDTGDLGVGDACDPDRDGLTVTEERFSPKPFAPDNCPNVFNPDQANCNLEYERASIARGTSVAILGDACDPVPCPKVVPPVNPPAPSCIAGPQFYRQVSNEIALTPIGSHVTHQLSIGTSPPAISVENVPTKARFCQPSATLGVRCDLPLVLRDAQLEQVRSAEAVVRVDPASPWQRISLRETPTGAVQPRNSNTGFSLRYGDAATKTLYWDYLADNTFWHRDGLDVLGVDAPAADCSKKRLFGNGTQDGTCLDGRFWTHADTPVGATQNTHDGVLVGIHGLDMANHVFDITPDRPIQVDGCEAPLLDTCFLAPLGCVSDLLYRFDYDSCPFCGVGFARTVADDRIQVPLLPGADELVHGLIWKTALVPGEELRLGPELQQSLRANHFVTAVESSAPRPGEVDAVAYDDFGAAEYLVVDEGQTHAYYIDLYAGGLMSSMSTLSTAPLSTMSAPPRSSSTSAVSGRTNAKLVYSRVMRGTFVVGGFDSNGPVSSVHYEPLYAPGYPISGAIEADVLAATLTKPSTLEAYYGGSAEPSYLWTVEQQTSGDVAVVLREITRDAVSSPLASVPLAHVPEYSYVLTTAWDSPDSVLLTVSDNQSGHWAVFETGGFLQECGAPLGILDPECLAVRPLRHFADFSDDRHLFRGVYAERDAIVFPRVAEDQAAGVLHRPVVERRERPVLGVSPRIDPMFLYQWL